MVILNGIYPTLLDIDFSYKNDRLSYFGSYHEGFGEFIKRNMDETRNRMTEQFY